MTTLKVSNFCIAQNIKSKIKRQMVSLGNTFAKHIQIYIYKKHLKINKKHYQYNRNLDKRIEQIVGWKEGKEGKRKIGRKENVF